MQLLPPPLFSFLSFLSSPERWRRKRRNRVVNGSRPDWKLCSKANGLVTGMLGKIKGGRVLLAEQRCLISVSFFPSLSLPLFLLFLLLVYLIPVFDVQKKKNITTTRRYEDFKKSSGNEEEVEIEYANNENTDTEHANIP